MRSHQAWPSAPDCWRWRGGHSFAAAAVQGLRRLRRLSRGHTRDPGGSAADTRTSRALRRASEHMGRVAIRWRSESYQLTRRGHSEGTQMARRWHSDGHSEGTQKALRRHSEGTQKALRRHSAGTQKALRRNPVVLTCDEKPRARDERRAGVGGEDIVSHTIPKCGIASDGDGKVDGESEG